MKLGKLVANREVIRRIAKAEINGAKSLKLRKTVLAELKHYEEAESEMLQKYGKRTKGGGIQLTEDMEGYSETTKFLNEMLGAEIEDLPVIFGEADIEHINISASDIEALEEVGILKLDEPAEDDIPPNAEAEPAADKKKSA